MKIVLALFIAAIAYSASAIGYPHRKASVPVGRSVERRAQNPADESRPAGIYLLSRGQLIRIDFNVSGQNRTNGMLATYFTARIAHTSIRAILQGVQAQVRTNERLRTFSFYLPEAVHAAGRSSCEN